jgi:predicted RNA-binding Zn-ribbon protein involved in translation (DUF1610 family)
MILNPKESIISYRCPHCGTTVMSMIGTFALSGDLIKLKCSCGESELVISYTNDNKIRITVPCLACENPHTYSISFSAFFQRELLELACKAIGINICFIGNKEKVFEAIERSDKELAEMMGEYSLDDLGKMGGSPEGSITDAQVFDLVRFMLCEMKEENAILCNCKDGMGEYELEFTKDGVDIFCTKCGARKTFDLNSVQKASDFLDVDELDLR